MSDFDFGEVEALRQRLGISQTRLCQMAEINPNTYQRWLRHARGQPGGNCPHPRSLAAVYQVLRGIDERRQQPPNAGGAGVPQSRPDNSVTAGEHGKSAGPPTDDDLPSSGVYRAA